MARRRTIKTVNSSFIEDAETIVTVLNKHMRYLRTDTPHYEAIAALNSRVVETARELHGGPVPWGLRSSTGPVLGEHEPVERQEQPLPPAHLLTRKAQALPNCTMLSSDWGAISSSVGPL